MEVVPGVQVYPLTGQAYERLVLMHRVYNHPGFRLGHVPFLKLLYDLLDQFQHVHGLILSNPEGL